MTKYEPLQEYLQSRGLDSIPMTFEQIEQLIGEKLPNSAFKHRPWWSNNPSNSVITKSWLSAGYKTSAVDMEKHKLTFKKVSKPRSDLAKPGHTPPPSLRNVDTLLNAMKGTITISVDFDITSGTGENWNAEEGRL